MRMYDLIEKKKTGRALSEEEIRWMTKAYTNEEIPDYQMSAMLMAICFNGLSDRELIERRRDACADPRHARQRRLHGPVCDPWDKSR